MTHSIETAAPTKQPDLRFERVVSVHEECSDVVITFLNAEGERRRAVFPASEEKWLRQCFLRLHGSGK